jgi:hypothetical protein
VKSFKFNQTAYSASPCLPCSTAFACLSWSKVLELARIIKNAAIFHATKNTIGVNLSVIESVEVADVVESSVVLPKSEEQT